MMITQLLCSTVRHGVPHVGHERVLQYVFQGAFHVFGQKGPDAFDEHVFHFHEQLVLRRLMVIVDGGGHGQQGMLRWFFGLILNPPESWLGIGRRMQRRANETGRSEEIVGWRGLDGRRRQ